MSNPGKQRKVIRSEGRAIIAKVFHFLQEEYHFMKTNNYDNCDLSPLANITKRTAEATGVSERTVSKILKEEKELPSPSAEFPSPMKKRCKREGKFDIDNLNHEVIRTIIQNYHIEHKEIPTLEKLQPVLKQRIGYDGCLSTLRSSLIKMGFKWQTIGNDRQVLQERHEIQLLRFNYLKKIHQYRLEGRPIVYAGETYVLTSLVRQDTGSLKTTDTKKKDTQFLKKSIKGPRFIIVHAGNNCGFIPNTSLVYKAESTTEDYPSNMNFDNYYGTWLQETLLPNLPEKSVIVMDNGSYNNNRSSIPTSNSRKGDMQKWLTENGIPFDESSRKIELYDLIEKNRERFTTSKIDDIIRSKGFKILRLPPYHPELNAIENIWGILKNQIASKNTEQNMTALLNLIHEGLNNFDNTTWSNTCKHVIEVEKQYLKYFDYDCEFLINVGEPNSGSDIEDSDCFYEEE